MNGILLSAALVTGKVAITATAVSLITGLFAAYAVTRMKKRCRIALDAVMTVPLALPPTVAGFALLWLLSRNGPLASLMGQWAPNLIFTWLGSALAASLVALPLVYRSTRSAFSRIDKSLIDAARTLGLSDIEIFSRVMLPLAARGILAGTLMAFARSVGEFGATLIVGGNIPGSTQTLSVAIYESINSGNTEDAALISIVTAILALVIMAAVEFAGRDERRPA